jgi:hypothetical protein
MSGLVVTFAMMETEKSDLIMKNFSRRRRNALGNIFKDVDHEELYAVYKVISALLFHQYMIVCIQCIK